MPSKPITPGRPLRVCPDFDATIFLRAQNQFFEEVVREITSGKKIGHWIWFIFPQLRELGSSTYSQIYGLKDVSEARCYLAHPVLRLRLETCIQAVIDSHPRRVNDIFTPLDAMKFHACLTLFDKAAPGGIFREAIDTCFEGNVHEKTRLLIGSGPASPLRFKLNQLRKLFTYQSRP